MEYRIIEDPKVVTFFRDSTDRKFKKILKLKFPIFGKNRGKMLLPNGLWGKIAPLYLQNNGNPLPKGLKISLTSV